MVGSGILDTDVALWSHAGFRGSARCHRTTEAPPKDSRKGKLLIIISMIINNLRTPIKRKQSCLHREYPRESCRRRRRRRHRRRLWQPLSNQALNCRKCRNDRFPKKPIIPDPRVLRKRGSPRGLPAVPGYSCFRTNIQLFGIHFRGFLTDQGAVGGDLARLRIMTELSDESDNSAIPEIPKLRDSRP